MEGHNTDQTGDQLLVCSFDKSNSGRVMKQDIHLSIEVSCGVSTYRLEDVFSSIIVSTERTECIMVIL